MNNYFVITHTVCAEFHTLREKYCRRATECSETPEKQPYFRDSFLSIEIAVELSNQFIDGFKIVSDFFVYLGI